MVARYPKRFSSVSQLSYVLKVIRSHSSHAVLSGHRLRTFLISLCTVLFPLLLPILAQATGDIVKIDHDRVEVNVKNAPLSLLLDRLARAGNFRVNMDDRLDRPVTVTISGRTLEQSLNMIGRQEAINLVIGWKRQPDGQSIIQSVDVLPEGNMDMDRLEQDFSAQASAYKQQKNKEKNSRSPEQRKRDREARRDKRTAQQKENYAKRRQKVGLQ